MEIDYSILPDLTPGDFDQDSDVDGDDLGHWQIHFGSGAGADADGDGDSDGADFLTWQRNYTGPSPAALATVPEPSAAVVLTLGLLLSAKATCRDRRTVNVVINAKENGFHV